MSLLSHSFSIICYKLSSSTVRLPHSCPLFWCHWTSYFNMVAMSVTLWMECFFSHISVFLSFLFWVVVPSKTSRTVPNIDTSLIFENQLCFDECSLIHIEWFAQEMSSVEQIIQTERDFFVKFDCDLVAYNRTVHQETDRMFFKITVHRTSLWVNTS